MYKLETNHLIQAKIDHSTKLNGWRLLSNKTVTLLAYNTLHFHTQGKALPVSLIIGAILSDNGGIHQQILFSWYREGNTNSVQVV